MFPEFFAIEAQDVSMVRVLQPNVRYKLPVMVALDFIDSHTPVVRLGYEVTGSSPDKYRDVQDTTSLDHWVNAKYTHHQDEHLESVPVERLFQQVYSWQRTTQRRTFIVVGLTLQGGIPLDFAVLLAQYGLVAFEWILHDNSTGLLIDFVPLGPIHMSQRQLRELEFWRNYFNSKGRKMNEVPVLEQFFHSRIVQRVKLNLLSALVLGFREVEERIVVQAEAEAVIEEEVTTSEEEVVHCLQTTQDVTVTEETTESVTVTTTPESDSSLRSGRRRRHFNKDPSDFRSERELDNKVWPPTIYDPGG
jgi:hypothetical protein